MSTPCKSISNSPYRVYLRIVDTKNLPLTGSAGAFLGLDPDDSPLVLRDQGRSDIYALTLQRN